MTDDSEPSPYPTLQWLVRNGTRVPLAGAALVAAGAFALAYAWGSALAAAVGIVVAACAYVGLRLAVELVTLITDMLMPK